MDKLILIINFLGAIAQLAYLIFKNKFEKDEALKAKKEELSKDAHEAIKNADTSKLLDVLSRLRNS